MHVIFFIILYWLMQLLQKVQTLTDVPEGKTMH